MATLTQYWNDEASRLDLALAAEPATLATLRNALTLAQAAQLPAPAHDRAEGGGETDDGAERERREDHERQRRHPDAVEIEAELDGTTVLHREAEQGDENDPAQQPQEDSHVA